MFCKHVWKTLSEVTLPSAFEQAKPIVDGSKLPYWAVEKTHLLVVACEKCGELKSFKDGNQVA